MFAVATNYRRLIACLAIGLQGLGVAVAGLGHTHYGDVACCQPSACRSEAAAQHHHGGTCSHAHDHAVEAPPTGQPADGSCPSDSPHDDCSLCRHFSQPVSPVTLIVEVPRSDSAHMLDAERVEQIATILPAAHPARGPPALCA